jgi:uncharacterized protein with ParB-like and HNH nuclease domain
MEAPLNAAAITAAQLFSSATFSIPPYQRGYAWTKDQVGEFLSDLRGSLPDRSYFLGLVVLTGDGEQKQVVDGQQRFLTLTMLASCLYREAELAGRKALAQKIDNSFLHSLDFDTDKVIPRITVTDNRDDGTLRGLIDNPTLILNSKKTTIIRKL